MEMNDNEIQTHELFGFDLLIDEFWNVWLLEVNAGPDLSQSTVRFHIYIYGYIWLSQSLMLF